MGLAIFVLFVWLIIIQCQLNKLSDTVNKNTIKNLYPETMYENSQPAEQNDVPAPSVSDNETNEITDNNLQTVSDEQLPKTKFLDFETTFLGNIFNKIGAIALVISCIVFIKIISPYVIFTPAMKISLGYIAAIILIISGCKMTDEKMKGYKESLLGTGFSVAFITTYCASALFHLFNPLLSTVLAILILGTVYYVADKQKTLSMIIIALIAGYINPIFINAHASNEFLFGYYIFLNLLSVIYVYRNPHRDYINFVNLSLTFIILSCILLFQESTINILYPLILWLVYLIYDVLRKEKISSDNIKDNILNWINLGILTLLTLLIFKEQKIYAGSLVLFVGLLYAGLVVRYVKQKTVSYKPYLYSSLILLLIGTYLSLDGIWRIGLLSLESLAISAAAFRYNLNYLCKWSFSFLFAVITVVLCSENVVYFNNIQEYTPIFNIRTAYFIFPLISAFISYKLLLKSNNSELNKIIELFRFLLISFVYLYFVFEINSLIYKYCSKLFDKDFVSLMIVSILGFKYASQMKSIGNKAELKLFDIGAYLTGLISLNTLLVAGFEYVPIQHFLPVINIRFVAFLTAIVCSALFARWTKLDAFKYLAVILGFVLVHVETRDFINAGIISNIDYLLTVMWLVYSGIITTIGIFKNKKYLKITGIWISIAAILRIFIYDLVDTDMIYKLVAFMTLGAVLMIISYFYNKYNNTVQK